MKSRVVLVSLVMVLALMLACSTPAPAPAPSPSPAPAATPTAKPAPSPTPSATPTTAASPKPVEKFPDMVFLTSYDVGSSSYACTLGVCDAIEKQTGTKLRVIPSGTDISRIIPVRSRQAQFLLATAGTGFSAVRGIEDFSTVQWGPQPLQMVYRAPMFTGLAVRANSGIKTPADLKGKRIPWTPGGTAINLLVQAHLAFGGLTWNDVTKVEVPSFTAGCQGIIKGTVDATVPSTSTADMYDLEASPHGIAWLNLDPNDKAAWARAQAVFPPLAPAPGQTAGAGITPQKPANVSQHSLITWAYEWQDPTLVYLMTKYTYQGYDTFKTSYAALVDWTPKAALNVIGMPFPYHPGSVRYFKEAGVWTPQLEEWNQKELSKQAARTKLWQETLAEATGKGVKEKDFPQLWLDKASKLQ